MRAEILQQGTVSVIRLDGLMTVDDLESTSETLLARSRTGQPRMLIDMSGVPLMDSAAMELLLDLQDGCSQRGGVVKLVGLSVLCREVMEVTGLLRQFELFDNQITALGSFAV